MFICVQGKNGVKWRVNLNMVQKYSMHGGKIIIIYNNYNHDEIDLESQDIAQETIKLIDYYLKPHNCIFKAQEND